MPIKAIPGPDGSIRDLQAQLAEVGRIRLGTFNGRYPEKLDRFRFTAADEALIGRVAERYGGTPAPWTPQGGRGQQWEVISDAKRIPVYVPPQFIDPWNEAWAAGRTCVRRCDGETEIIKDEPCPCRAGLIKNPRDLCRPTIRVQLMLVDVPGIGSWRLESHGRYAVERLVILAPLVRRVPLPVPAFLLLKEETRRPWNEEKQKFDSLTFYVPEVRIDAVSAAQIAVGGDALTQALTAAGAPTALTAGPVRAIEAAPEPAEVSREELDRIMVAIEKANTPKALREIQTALMDRGIDHPTVIASWQSKAAAVVAADELAAQGGSYAIGDQVPEPSPMTIPDQAEHQASLKRAVESAAQAAGRSRENIAPAKADQPCNDPFCGGEKSGCGWTFKAHQEFHGDNLVRNMPLGLIPERPVVVPAIPPGTDIEDAVIVELPGNMPDAVTVRRASGNLPGARARLMAAAGGLGWTTGETLQRLADHHQIESGMKATAAQISEFCEAIERGIVQ